MLPTQWGIPYVLWAGAAALGAIALLQLLYYLVLLVPKRGSQPVRQPTSPVMPTRPAGIDSKQQPAPVTGGKLVIVSGLANVDEIPLPSSSFIMGRYYHPENNIHVALDERSISRRHAQFDGVDSRREYTLTDLNSSYGTGLRAAGKLQPLPPGQRFRIYNGDEIQFGQHIVIRFELPGDKRPAPTEEPVQNTRV